jgi:hypothetical protein
MDKSPASESRVRQPLPQVSELEREFWRQAVDRERRRMAARPATMPSPVR